MTINYNRPTLVRVEAMIGDYLVDRSSNLIAYQYNFIDCFYDKSIYQIKYSQDEIFKVKKSKYHAVSKRKIQTPRNRDKISSQNARFKKICSTIQRRPSPESHFLEIPTHNRKKIKRLSNCIGPPWIRCFVTHTISSQLAGSNQTSRIQEQKEKLKAAGNCNSRFHLRASGSSV